MEIIIIILIAVIIYLLFKSKKKSSKTETIPQTTEEPVKVTQNLPYKKKLLLTTNEWSFYKSLKPVADELGYSVLAKIRLADLVEVNVSDKKDYMKYFNKINKKHVDFVLAKPENLQIELLIELDDNSHNTAQKERDEFIETLYEQTGYKLLRVRGSAELKTKIEKAINIQPAQSIIPQEN